jgi:methionyl-tRNA formyltransferase
MPDELKIAIIGWGFNAEKCLDAMLKEGVVPKVAFLPEKYHYQPMQNRCAEHAIKSVVFESIDLLKGKTENAGLDLLISASCPYRIPMAMTSSFRLGGINIHASYLPLYRGVHPVNWALINGENEIGVTIHRMDDNIDTGDIIKQEMIPVKIEDDINTMVAKLTDLGAELLVDVIRQYRDGSVKTKKQIRIAPCPTAPKRTPNQGKIDWKQDSAAIFNLCRSLYEPYPNAFCELDSHTVKVKKVFVDSVPGKVLAIVDSKRVVVSTDDGVIFCEVESIHDIRVGDVFH